MNTEGPEVDETDGLLTKNKVQPHQTRHVPCQDCIWAILFLIVWFGYLIAGFMAFSQNRDKLLHPKDEDDSNNTNSPMLSLTAKSVEIMGFIFGVSILVSVGWMIVMKMFARQLIMFTLILGVVLSLAFAVLGFYVGNIALGVICLLLCVFNVIYIFWVQDRIGFASTMLSIVIKVVEGYPATVAVALLGIIVQTLDLILWLICLVAIVYALGMREHNDANHSEDQDVGPGIFITFAIFVFYWASQVVTNVVHVTISGCVATWYFISPIPPNPTYSAFKRATSTSFGSICLGSLLIAILRTIHFLIRRATRNSNACVKCIADCIMNCLESIMLYFNKYAFTRVAIYGQSYTEAGKGAWQLLKARGIDALVNDNLIEGVLFFGAFLGGLVCCGVVVVFTYFSSTPEWQLWAVLAFFLGFGVTICAMEVIDSGVATIFVCVAENPQRFEDTHPAEARELFDQMRAVYPEVARNLNNPAADEEAALMQGNARGYL